MAEAAAVSMAEAAAVSMAEAAAIARRKHARRRERWEDLEQWEEWLDCRRVGMHRTSTQEGLPARHTQIGARQCSVGSRFQSVV